MKTLLVLAAAAVALANITCAGPAIDVIHSTGADAFTLVDNHGAVAIVTDPQDYPVVGLAAGFFADDVQRVSGHRPLVGGSTTAPQVVFVGTLGHSAMIDRLAAEGRLTGIDQIKGQWEATLWEIVDHPAQGVDRALVIVGSDRRGAAYGLTTLSEKIGVSPWYWWADAAVPHAGVVAVKLPGPQTDAPAVKYRGIFINDEDWGLQPWAAKTFDPEFGNIGPKTYAKVFELLLRLRLNYLWPAMHACTAEFASDPENVRLADRFGIVAGASHCEPMLCNNVHWDEKTQGKWDYTLNRDAIHRYWEDSAKARGGDEAVWTLGIRGIHDRAMEGPKEIPARINIVGDVIRDQRALLDRHVTREWGPVAQCFVPYKEVLPIYDAGLKVPEDVTLVWVDDNFGYIRRLSAPLERSRSGGSGVYWHMSYYGGPHSYTWINTTAPAFLWEELRKAWDNDARRLWVINVGDIKPMEIGIDCFARLAWNAPEAGPDSQPSLLRAFAEGNFGAALAPGITDLLTRFYHLGTIHKPELMTREWALTLTSSEAEDLGKRYRALLDSEQALIAAVPANSRDAFFETIGFPARVLGTTGLIFLADRKVQLGDDPAGRQEEIARLRSDLEAQVTTYNTATAGGKWNHMMPGLVTGKVLNAWSSQVRWPWGNPAANAAELATKAKAEAAARNQLRWRDAAEYDRARKASNGAGWRAVAGLGTSGRALALLPEALTSSWNAGDAQAPAVEYSFDATAGTTEVVIDFLPSFRIHPSLLLRVAVSVDGHAPDLVEVPGSNGKEDERGQLRQSAVQDNFVRARLALPGLSAGRHILRIQAVDPGVVIDRIAL